MLLKSSFQIISISCIEFAIFQAKQYIYEEEIIQFETIWQG